MLELIGPNKQRHPVEIHGALNEAAPKKHDK
jgi:hypothetical protein